jgi:hypothetical protein
MAECGCLWNTKSEQCRNKEARENALKKIVQELNFPGLIAEDVQLKIGTFRAKCVAEKKKKKIPEIGWHPAWRLYCTNLSVNKGPFFNIFLYIN